MTPKNYPSDIIPTNGKFEPQELTFARLNSTIHLATKKIASGDWSELEVNSYCGANSINAACIKRVFRHDNNIQTWANYQTDDGIINRDNGYWDKLYKDRQHDKTKYEI